MEEDIKILKDTLDKMKKYNFIIQYKDIYFDGRDVSTIENILNRLEQDERVIEEMESKLKEIQDEYLDFCPDCVDLANDLLKIIEHFRKRVDNNE